MSSSLMIGSRVLVRAWDQLRIDSRSPSGMPSSSVITWNGSGKASSSTTSQGPDGDPVEHGVHLRLDAGPELLDPADRERLGHELADAGVGPAGTRLRIAQVTPLAGSSPPNSSSRSANMVSRISFQAALDVAVLHRGSGVAQQGEHVLVPGQHPDPQRALVDRVLLLAQLGHVGIADQPGRPGPAG